MKIIILVGLIPLLMICCGTENQREPVDYVYQIPEQIDDGWETCAAADTGMDMAPLNEFMHELINNIEHKIHGIVIVKRGKLVFEEYFPGFRFYHGAYTEFGKGTVHNLASVTKSLTSALIGIAIDRGLIKSVDQKLFSFFPEYVHLSDPQKEGITLEHVLTMSAGLDWDESTYPYSDPRNDVYRIWRVDDPVEFILGKSAIGEPGKVFLYNSGLTIILGEIIRKVSGMRADEFAEKYLFPVLNITDHDWDEFPNGVLFVSGDLRMLPRDMAKLGELYLRAGVWKESRVLPEEWVNSSLESHISTYDEDWQYGYQWWIPAGELYPEQKTKFSARGWGGQNIIVFPGLELVIVTTAGYYDTPEIEFHIQLLIDRILLASQ